MEAVMTAPTAPERSLAQRQEALQKANAIRSHRAALKDKIKHGEESIVGVLRDPGPLVHTMKVYELMLAAPKVGRVKANKWLSQARISPSKTIGGLSHRQRLELVAILRSR